MSEIAPVTAPAPEPAPEPISMDVASVTAPDGQVEVCNNSHEALKETSEKKQRPRRAVQAAVEPSPAPVIKEAVKVQGNSKKRQRVDPPKRFSKDDAHGEKLIKRLQEIIEGEPDSCDLTLVAEGDVDIRLHSVIARALAPGLKNTLPSLVGTVKMAGISSNVLQALVQYMYRGEIEITDANASETLAAATALGIKGAQDLCGQFLQADVSPVNALSRYSTAIANGLDSLKDAVMDCVDKNFEVCLMICFYVYVDLTPVRICHAGRGSFSRVVGPG